jgi:hypothetical protein
MTTPFLLPTAELVAQAWISTIANLPAQVGSTLPPDDTQWASTGFVTVAVVGGNPDPDVPIKTSVMQVDCWAVKPGSNKPPWQQAASCAGQIAAACYDRRLGYFGRPLVISVNGVDYPGANVMSARAMTEPRRAYGDTADYACYTFDLQLVWRAVGTDLFPTD